MTVGIVAVVGTSVDSGSGGADDKSNDDGIVGWGQDVESKEVESCPIGSLALRMLENEEREDACDVLSLARRLWGVPMLVRSWLSLFRLEAAEERTEPGAEPAEIRFEIMSMGPG